MKNDIGTRMKKFYEIRTRTFLPRKTHTIIRIDGKNFGTYTKGLQKPFDDGFIEDMNKTTEFLCSKIQGAKLGYCQSDEISILLTDYDSISSDAWFDGNVQKIVSIAASLATTKFNQLRLKRELKAYSPIGEDMDIDDAIKIVDETKNAAFDARAFSIPDIDEVVNYFIWRQQDATRNSISMVAQRFFSHKALHKKSTNEMQAMLFTEKMINWNNFAIRKKRGGLITKKSILYYNDENNKKIQISQLDRDKHVNVYERNKWIHNEDTPIFSLDKRAILDEMPIQKTYLADL